MIIGLLNIQEVEPVNPHLHDYWLGIHPGFSFLNYAAFAIARISGIRFLLQQKEIKKKKLGVLFHFQPPLEYLDKVNQYSIIV